MIWVMLLQLVMTPTCQVGKPCPGPVSHQQYLSARYATEAACRKALPGFQMAFGQGRKTTMNGMSYASTGTVECVVAGGGQ